MKECQVKLLNQVLENGVFYIAEDVEVCAFKTRLQCESANKDLYCRIAVPCDMSQPQKEGCTFHQFETEIIPQICKGCKERSRHEPRNRNSLQ